MISHTGLLIIVAAVMSFFLRAAPLLFKKKLDDIQKSKFVIFLNYTACAIIGGIICITAFPITKHTSILTTMNVKDILKLLTIIASFLINLKLRKPILTFLVCIGVYAALSFIPL